MTADRLVNAVVRVENDAKGATWFRVALKVLLDRDQIAVCQGPSGRREARNAAADLFNAKRYAEAHEAYREAARSWPEAVWAWKGMADSLYRVNRRTEAAEAYWKLVELSPGDVDALCWLANSLLKADPREAADLFEKVIAAEPSKPRGITGLGWALENLNRKPEAVEAHRKAVELAPNDADAVLAYAFALLIENDEEAERQFQKALAMKPDEARAHVGLGYARSNLERYTDALASFATARQLCADCMNDHDREFEAEVRRFAHRK